MKLEVKLQFPDYQSLREFRREAKLVSFSVIHSANILRMPGEEHQIKLATEKYRATIIRN